jgi:hypothetical protein
LFQSSPGRAISELQHAERTGRVKQLADQLLEVDLTTFSSQSPPGRWKPAWSAAGCHEVRHYFLITLCRVRGIYYDLDLVTLGFFTFLDYIV